MWGEFITESEKKEKKQDKTLEQPNNQHQHQKTRIHGKTDKKRKPGNA